MLESRAPAAVLRACSGRLRRQARATRSTSERLRSIARETLIRSALSSRRRLAGGSGSPADGRRAFALDIARELTPPLTTLWNRIEVMLAETRGGEPPADAVADLETLRRTAARMAAILGGLAAIGGEPGLEARAVDLNLLVEDSLSALGPWLRARRVRLEPHLDPAIPPALADFDGVHYALTALVEAAADASTTIDVTTRCAQDGHVRIDVGGDAQRMRGITLEDPLRLVLADAIVRSLGGRVERRSGNPGATFTMSLRAAGP